VITAAVAELPSPDVQMKGEFALVSVCAWCGTYIRSVPVSRQPAGQSHGICPECREKVMGSGPQPGTVA
jgi:hypothetical protein